MGKVFQAVTAASNDYQVVSIRAKRSAKAAPIPDQAPLPPREEVPSFLLPWILLPERE